MNPLENPNQFFSQYIQLSGVAHLGPEKHGDTALLGKKLGLLNGSSWITAWSNYFGRLYLPGVHLVNIGNEAIQLNFWPRVRMKFPTVVRGQIYIPSVNWLLWAGCLAVMFIFRESGHMEAAYGFFIVIAMLMTTTLIFGYLWFVRRWPLWMVLPVIGLFLTVECAYFVANGEKSSWFGWPTDPEMEKMRDAYAKETDPVKNKQLAAAVQARALQTAQYGWVGQWYGPGAMRSNIQGWLKAPVPVKWNIEKK